MIPGLNPLGVNPKVLAYITRLLSDAQTRQTDLINQQQTSAGKDITGFYSAAAEALGRNAVDLQSSYANAGAGQDAFGQGYAHGLKLLQDQSATGGNTLLAQQGSPQKVTAGQGAADVLGFTGGTIPAQQLGTEGAGAVLGAAAGPKNLISEGANALRTSNARYQQQFADLVGNLPGQQLDYILKAADLSQRQAALKVAARAAAGKYAGNPNYYPDQNSPSGYTPKGYKYNAQGQLVRIPGAKGGGGKKGRDFQKTIVNLTSDVKGQLQTQYKDVYGKGRPVQVGSQVHNVPVDPITGLAYDPQNPPQDPATGKPLPPKLVTQTVPVYKKAGGGTTLDPILAIHEQTTRKVRLPSADYNQLYTYIVTQLQLQYPQLTDQKARSTAVEILRSLNVGQKTIKGRPGG